MHNIRMYEAILLSMTAVDMPTAGIMIRKLFILSLVLAVCLELSQGKPSPQAKTMEDYAEALIQGVCMYA